MALELTFVPLPREPREDPFLVRERVAHLDLLLPDVRELCVLAPSAPGWNERAQELERVLRLWPVLCEGALVEQGVKLSGEALEDLLRQHAPAAPRAWLPVVAQWAEARQVQQLWTQCAAISLSPGGRLLEFERRLRERRDQLAQRARGWSPAWWFRSVFRVQSQR